MTNSNEYANILDTLNSLYPDVESEVAILNFIADCQNGVYGEEGKAKAAKFKQH
ncbi:hypothetical protein Syn8016DRAFT_1106 [Synechococcus sp. WH 8016]|nr:hypothetical protein Syn8016DRAFT_1106 [Synechococcus sp. WH 8016]